MLRLLLPCAVLAATAVPASADDKPPGGPLVTRNQTRLNAKGVAVVLAAAQEKATAMKLTLNIAVTDDGGHPLGFVRMDGARPASSYTAITKATAAATYRQATGPSPGAEVSLLNLAAAAAAAASGGKITPLKGGVPIVVDGQVIGAVGVGGGSGEQDAEVAQAGIDALLRAIGAASKAP